MGVFARLLRRSKATEEAAAEAGSDTAQAGSEAAEAASTAEVKAAEGTPEAAEPAVKGSEGAESAKGTESEGVDIPKQQSTDKAADNEAGDSART
ncbi:hypothetical protein ACPXCS_09475 [Streptomyces sp. DT190]|uniref:hypothetical protein n=1 Tax=unclassified Streptomyces TaxID=2593676 RepID=UPI003CEE51D6